MPELTNGSNMSGSGDAAAGASGAQQEAESPTRMTGASEAAAGGLSDDQGSDRASDAGLVSEETDQPSKDEVVEAAYDFSAFDSALEQFLGDSGLKGATAAVVHREFGVVHAAGYGSFDAQRPVLLASASKILSVGILMHLQDDGIVDIDAPIETYLEPAFGAAGHSKGAITIAQLLSNSSGLVSLLDDSAYAPYVCQFSQAQELSECGRQIYTTEDDWWGMEPPDGRWRYGGAQWHLAGAVAEVASGKSWQELVDEIYVQPCGVDSLGYVNQYEAHGTAYPSVEGDDLAGLGGQDNPSIEGGGYANATDYGKLLLMHLRNGTCDDERVLSPESVRRMQMDRIARYGGSTLHPILNGYGMGWWVERTYPARVVDNGLYGAMAWLDNERDYGAVVLLEADALLGQAMYDSVRPALEAEFAPESRAAAP